MDNSLIEQLQRIQIVKKLQENRSFLKDARGYPIAEVDETDDQIVLYSLMGLMKGRYSKRDNMTFYPTGLSVGSGNLLGTLIYT